MFARLAFGGTFSVKTAVPVPGWETRNVTLLGDALHNMTPFRGMGANVALRDASALRRALVRVVRGESLNGKDTSAPRLKSGAI
jgi:2-polyprenyl-6-methoxyphenol hydroxylase-like FAD-dependent oxidoreductase